MRNISYTNTFQKLSCIFISKNDRNNTFETVYDNSLMNPLKKGKFMNK